MGSGGPSARTIVESADITRTKGPKRVGPFAVPKAMSSTASATLATWFKIKGVNYSISSACATSNHCIGNAYETIQIGKQDIIFAGGCEELDWTLSVLFDAMGAMSSKYNDTPATASRPYDVSRDGFVIAGGAGVVVLEELEARQGARRPDLRRNRRLRRHLRRLRHGGALGRGRRALHAHGAGDGRRRKIDYINPHATSTPAGDPPEIEAIRKVFGTGDKCPPISATKALTGHSLGATGVQEAIYSLLMMNNGFICESANITELDPVFADMPIVRKRIDNAKLGTVLSNSFGFGGTNATLVFKRMDATEARDAARHAGHPPPRSGPQHHRAAPPVSRIKGGISACHRSMQGKRGLIMGVANDHSIAWGMARTLAAHGAELAFTYQGDALGKRVKPLAQSLNVAAGAALRRRGHRQRRRRVRGAAAKLGHAGFPGPRHRLLRQERAARPLCRHHARELLAHHADLVLLLHRGRQARGGDDAVGRVDHHADLRRLGARRCRTTTSWASPRRRWKPRCAISPPTSAARTSASTRSRPVRCARWRAPASAIPAPCSRFMQKHSPLGRGVTLDELGGSALYLLSELSGGVTGEIHYVDSGYNTVSMPRLDDAEVRRHLTARGKAATRRRPAPAGTPAVPRRRSR